MLATHAQETCTRKNLRHTCKLHKFLVRVSWAYVAGMHV